MQFEHDQILDHEGIILQADWLHYPCCHSSNDTGQYPVGMGDISGAHLALSIYSLLELCDRGRLVFLLSLNQA